LDRPAGSVLEVLWRIAGNLDQAIAASLPTMPTSPRPEGLHAKYVIKQLNYIQSLVRTAPVMHGIVKDLTPDELRAVAAYVQSKRSGRDKHAARSPCNTP
jgi:cytochrome c553